MCLLGHDVEFVSYCKSQSKSVKARSLKRNDAHQLALWDQLPCCAERTGGGQAWAQEQAMGRLEMAVFTWGPGWWGQTKVLQVDTRTLRRAGLHEEGVRNATWVAEVSTLGNQWALLPFSEARGTRQQQFLRQKKIMRSGHVKIQG